MTVPDFDPYASRGFGDVTSQAVDDEHKLTGDSLEICRHRLLKAAARRAILDARSVDSLKMPLLWMLEQIDQPLWPSNHAALKDFCVSVTGG